MSRKHLPAAVLVSIGCSVAFATRLHRAYDVLQVSDAARACVRAATERAKEARKEADRLAVEAWNKRMLGFRGPAQPSPTLGDALNTGYSYLEVRCLGCDTHQTVALDVVRRLKTTPI